MLPGDALIDDLVQRVVAIVGRGFGHSVGISDARRCKRHTLAGRGRDIDLQRTWERRNCAAQIGGLAGANG